MRVFETKFQVSEGGSTVFNLKTTKGYTHGIPNMCNDLTIKVDFSNRDSNSDVLDEIFRNNIAIDICNHLNSIYVFKED